MVQNIDTECAPQTSEIATPTPPSDLNTFTEDAYIPTNRHEVAVMFLQMPVFGHNHKSIIKGNRNSTGHYLLQSRMLEFIRVRMTK